jgi:hypothetical protein
VKDNPFAPTTFTPLLRRLFVNERKLEGEETRLLYEECRAYQDQLGTDPEQEAHRVYLEYLYLPEEIFTPLRAMIRELVQQEQYIWELPPPELDRMTLAEQVRYRELLRKKQAFFRNKEEYLRLLHETLYRIAGAFSDGLPLTQSPSPFTLPLINSWEEPGTNLQRLLHLLIEEPIKERGILFSAKEKIWHNLASYNDMLPDQEVKKPLKGPMEAELPPEGLVSTFLEGTAFASYFRSHLPIKFDADIRMNHMHVIGGTGAGKTTLIENIVLHDLERDDPPGMVIVDGQGDLIRKLSRLEVFHPAEGKLRDRIIVINPKDIKFPPALNVFDLKKSRLAGYDEVMKEQITAGAIQTFDYLFSGLLGADLSAKQGVFFKYMARLMLAIPEGLGRNATILDMMQLMEDPAPYRPAIEKLPPIQRAWFERDFKQPSFNATREQIRYRLAAILENPTIARLFTQPETKIDLFEEMNNGAIILVDTAKDFLKDASPHFGRIFISLALQAILERAALPQDERRDTYLIVDEAGSYFDSNIDEFLTDARKYRCGCLFAHQYLDQAAPALRASLAANTGSKFACRTSDADSRTLARDMRTTPKFILQQPSLSFAAYIRDVTPAAVALPVRTGLLNDHMDSDAYEQLVARNRRRVSLETPGSISPRPEEPEEDVSAKW